MKRTQQEIDKLFSELEATKKELIQKEQVIARLKEELKSLHHDNGISERENHLKQISSNMERAQQMATMGSWVLDVDTGEVAWTPELHKIFGQPPSSPVPTLEEQESWYTKPSWNLMVEAVNRTINEGSPYNLELEMIRRDGSIGTLRSIGEAERDETGRIIRLRGVAHDISDIKETEAKLRFALNQEKTAQVYKDQFLANMTHEIRTPMNGVVGFASLLRDESLDAEMRNDYINIIEGCSNQLLNLIDDIIDIVKIEAGEIKITNKPFYAIDIIHETAATLETIKSSKDKEHIRLVINTPEEAENLKINSDALRVQQILTNLLNNALKFSDKGSIDFGFELNDGAVEFFVKDEGIGIEPERINLIFNRFEHLEGTVKKYEGTGLGLSISKGLAELLGAKLTVESKLGVGSTFRLIIPQDTVTPTDEEDCRTSAKACPDELQSCTLLVAEDQAVNQKLIARVFEKSPIKILFVGDGEQAVRTYQEHPEIDIVLLDIRMPIMNGDVAAQEILKINPEAKVIAHTAYAMHEDRENFLRLGFVDYLKKPYKAEDLRALVKKWTEINDLFTPRPEQP